jgi:hypothetical protein
MQILHIPSQNMTFIFIETELLNETRIFLISFRNFYSLTYLLLVPDNFACNFNPAGDNFLFDIADGIQWWSDLLKLLFFYHLFKFHELVEIHVFIVFFCHCQCL